MHGGPRRGRMSNEKSKDFIGSLKRIFKELNAYHVLIIIALVMAGVSALLAIIAPSRLSDLTNAITEGIAINQDNMETITTTTINNIKDLDVEKFMSDSSIPLEDKNITIAYMTTTTDDKDKINNLKELPYTVQSYIYPTYEIDGVTITTDDQIDYLILLSNLDQNDKSAIISAIDQAPERIQSVIVPKLNMDKVVRIAVLLASIYIVSSLLSYVTSILTAYISNLSARDLRSRISLKINKLPLKYFDNNQVGDTLSRVTNDVDTIAQSLNNSLSTIVTSITLFVGSIIMMYVTNWIMATTAILSTIVGFVLMFVILGKSQKYFSLRQSELGKLNSHIEEVYSGLIVVKAYNGKNLMDKEFDKLNEKVYQANMMSQFLSGLMQPLMQFVGNFGYVAVCIVGALLALNGVISFGVIVAFMIYIRLFTNPLSQMAQALTSLQSTAAAGERVFEFLDEPEMADESNIKNKLTVKNAKGNIEFKHVKFGYDPKKTIIKDFSCNVKAGSKIAIVGPTGAGKTTMVNLLMKFYDINSGDIIIDGTSIKDLSRDNIHNLFTMVLQDTWLFDGTVKDNIKFNKKNITDKQIMDALNSVGLTHFINTLPDGINSEISGDNSISSGQKQLLTIARGLLEDAPFLILDEATSNVDTRTEELVQKAMDKLMANHTSFIIAHRLSTIKNADLILVMDKGNIIEMGTHKELMNLNGFYANLYNSQFEL